MEAKGRLGEERKRAQSVDFMNGKVRGRERERGGGGEREGRGRGEI